MTLELLCSICAPEEEGRWRTHRAIYQRRGGAESSFELLYKIPRHIRALETDDAEPWLVAGIMLAMEEGRNLHISGRASRKLMAGLETIVAAWSEWQPEKYQRISLSADTITESGGACPADRGVIMPFSGGVDSSYTLWRHRLKRAGYQQQTLTHVTMICGLDIPYAEMPAYEQAMQRQAELFPPGSLPLLPAATNFREVIPCKWIEYYGAALISTLYFFKAECHTALIPASETMGVGCIAGGSNPITDPLFSGADLSLMQDGAELTRPQKIKSLAQWGVDTNHLRVCWENPDRATNCGTCEKCMRTRISFLACGLTPPESLCHSDTESDIRKLSLLKKENYRTIYEDIIAEAAHHGVTAPWCLLLEKRLLWFRRRRLLKELLSSFYHPHGS